MLPAQLCYFAISFSFSFFFHLALLVLIQRSFFFLVYNFSLVFFFNQICPNEKYLPKYTLFKQNSFICYQNYYVTFQFFFLFRAPCFYWKIFSLLLIHTFSALSAGAVEYADCTSAKGFYPTPPTSVWDTKQSDGEAPVMLVPRSITGMEW